MFRWYRDAKTCIAYLVDLEAATLPLEPRLSRCRWFYRGWCLEELIASKQILFFTQDWNYVGDKHSLKSLISAITRIDEEILEDSERMLSVPVGRRMSWAANRKTTRVEDVAYSLLGLFDVNIPCNMERERRPLCDCKKKL